MFPWLARGVPATNSAEENWVLLIRTKLPPHPVQCVAGWCPSRSQSRQIGAGVIRTSNVPALGNRAARAPLMNREPRVRRMSQFNIVIHYFTQTR